MHCTVAAPCKSIGCVRTYRDLAHGPVTSCTMQQSQVGSIFFPAVLQGRRCLFSHTETRVLKKRWTFTLSCGCHSGYRARNAKGLNIMELNSRYSPLFQWGKESPRRLSSPQMAAYQNSPPDASLPHPDGTSKWWHQRAALPGVTSSPDLPAGCRESMHRSGILSAAAHLTLCFDSALYLVQSKPST